MGARMMIQTDGHVRRNSFRETSHAWFGGHRTHRPVDTARSSGLYSTMCLGILGRIVEIDESLTEPLARVDVEGVHHMINVGMLECTPTVGDRILIHMGFALELIDEVDAEEAAPTTNGPDDDSESWARHV